MTMKELKMRVIEKHWKDSPGHPYRSFRRAKWYEVKWLVYLSRWTRSKVVMKARFPFVRTKVDFSSGAPLVAVGKSIVWKADWIGGL